MGVLTKLWVAAAVLWSVTGHAQPSAADRALATELFKQGRELMAKKAYAEACPRFEESQRLDPGGGTLLNLALCHEAIGKTATAWAELNEAIAIAHREGRGDREKLAQEHLSAIEPKLSRLVIAVTSAADLPDLVIKRDGSPVARVAWGTAMPVDPGTHQIEASAPGRVSWRVEVTVGADADRQTITVPPLETAAPEPKPVAEVEPQPRPPLAAPKPAPQLEPVDAPSVDYRAMLISGIVIGGVGVVGLGIGIGFGVDAIDKKQQSDDACVGGCTDVGAQKSTEAVRSADAATAALLVGGVLAAGGTALLVWSTVDTDKASVALHPTGATLTATW